MPADYFSVGNVRNCFAEGTGRTLLFRIAGADRIPVNDQGRACLIMSCGEDTGVRGYRYSEGSERGTCAADKLAGKRTMIMAGNFDVHGLSIAAISVCSP